MICLRGPVDPAATLGSAATVTSSWAASRPFAVCQQATLGGGRKEG